jgi:hypothetical protein
MKVWILRHLKISYKKLIHKIQKQLHKNLPKCLFDNNTFLVIKNHKIPKAIFHQSKLLCIQVELTQKHQMLKKLLLESLHYLV